MGDRIAFEADSPVFIVGSGRCGSTVFQHLLNTRSEFLIWGEHGGFLRHIAEAYYFRDGTEAIENIREWTGEASEDKRVKRLREPNRWTGWDNAFSLGEWDNRYRQIIRSFFTITGLQQNRWGFKEIRYGWTEDRTLQMLLACFPHAKFVVVVREPMATVFSMLASWHRDLRVGGSAIDETLLSVTGGWRDQYDNLKRFQESSPASCLICRFEDLKTPALLQRLTSFLNVAEPFSSADLNPRNLDACEKNDQLAKQIRERMKALQGRLEEMTSATQQRYGYSTGWNIE